MRCALFGGCRCRIVRARSDRPAFVFRGCWNSIQRSLLPAYGIGADYRFTRPKPSFCEGLGMCPTVWTGRSTPCSHPVVRRLIKFEG